MTEVIFETRRDPVDGGFAASAIGVGIHPQADTIEELRAHAREAAECYFGEEADGQNAILIHFMNAEDPAR